MTVPFTKTLTWRHRTVTGTNSDGNDTYTDVDSSVQGVVAPGVSTEQIDGRDTVVSQPTAYLPADVIPTATDAIGDDGAWYEVDGDPQVWPQHPFTGWRPPLPVVVPLRRVTG